MFPRLIAAASLRAALSRLPSAGAAGIALATGMAGMAVAADAQTAPMSTQSYIDQATLSDIFEIQSGKLARNKSQNDDIRAFGGRMVLDHTNSSERLRKTLADIGGDISVPTQLDDRRMALLERLNEIPTGQFDRLYVDMQVTAHEQALKLHRDYAGNGENEALRDVAEDIADTVERHLDAVRDMARGQGY
ncbi:DUF4142 domain-containing protein (plasmid) [Tistrella bauzanensis]|uniref:DUF4142 domain-containing protein n=1 Tax=Tistrella TaxID=171436 RepID=UPI0031F713C0